MDLVVLDVYQFSLVASNNGQLFDRHHPTGRM